MEQRDKVNQVQELWAPVFPARISRRLRYSTNVQLVSASGAVATHVFSANGAYDPDITGAGHQMMGFDQMMLSYNHYVVTSSKITCTFKNTSSTLPTVSIFVGASATPITVIDQIVEYGTLTRDTLEFKGVTGDVKTLDAYCSIKKIQGVDDVVDVQDLQGNAAANPAEQSYFHVQCWDAAAASSTINVDVMLEMNIIFKEPRVLSTSLVKAIEGLLVKEQKTSSAR